MSSRFASIMKYDCSLDVPLVEIVHFDRLRAKIRMGVPSCSWGVAGYTLFRALTKRTPCHDICVFIGVNGYVSSLMGWGAARVGRDYTLESGKQQNCQPA
jgi:hypothetical protein